MNYQTYQNMIYYFKYLPHTKYKNNFYIIKTYQTSTTNNPIGGEHATFQIYFFYFPIWLHVYLLYFPLKKKYKIVGELMYIWNKKMTVCSIQMNEITVLFKYA